MPRAPSTRRAEGQRRWIALASLSALLLTAVPARADDASPGPSVADYLSRLEEAGLLDVQTGDEKSLRRELGAAEELLREGALIDAAVALYSIVESPRYIGFEDFIEFQNARYDLAMALARSGSYGAALEHAAKVIERGPGTLYFAPAHRLVVDVGLEADRIEGVLALLDGIKLDEPVPPSVAGELSYLRARLAYDRGDLSAAEGELASIPKSCRLYSSALYLRGVIRTRRGELGAAADALCEIVDTPSNDTFTFVVDERYFRIVDLARLGLGRLAHEAGEYDDAYYHYFQVPEDSNRLSEALFEAAWSMYQKRELGTARDLVAEFSTAFPRSPLTPEAELLAGYVELADCKFDEAQAHYDEVIAEFGPIVEELERVRADPELRRQLFERAITRWRVERDEPDARPATEPRDGLDRVVGLLRLDPRFVRIHDSVTGLRRAAADAPHVIRAWRSLGARVSGTRVAAVANDAPPSDAADAAALLDEVRRLEDDLGRARAELRRGVRAGTLAREAADAESQRLGALAAELGDLRDDVTRAAAASDDSLAARAPAGLSPLIEAELRRARKLERAGAALLAELESTAEKLAVRSLEDLYETTRRVVDKAKLGKIDAVIGQKRRLEIEVQDLAAGRFPPELQGKLWEEGLIGDDEEYWPFEGEYWEDEYEGWR